MSEIHKIEKNGVTIYPATTTDAVVDPFFKASSSDTTIVYNMSAIFPTSGKNGTNKYDLETAVALFLTMSITRKKEGIILCFLNENGMLEWYRAKSESFTVKGTWERILSDVYNLTNEKPLPEGQYYQCTDANSANFAPSFIDTTLRRLGFLLLIRIGEFEWGLYSFVSSSISAWTAANRWVKMATNEDLNEIKKQNTNTKIKIGNISNNNGTVIHVSIPDFILTENVVFGIKFEKAIYNKIPALNVSGTGDKEIILYNGEKISLKDVRHPEKVYVFQYNGNYFILLNPDDFTDIELSNQLSHSLKNDLEIGYISTSCVDSDLSTRLRTKSGKLYKSPVTLEIKTGYVLHTIIKINLENSTSEYESANGEGSYKIPEDNLYRRFVFRKKDNSAFSQVEDVANIIGIDDYDKLHNKPSINNVEIKGNMSLSDLGISESGGTERLDLTKVDTLLLVGTSHTEGNGSLKDKSMPSYLSALNDWNVINLGVSGCDYIECYYYLLNNTTLTGSKWSDVLTGGICLDFLGGNAENTYFLNPMDAKYSVYNMKRLYSLLQSKGFEVVPCSYWGDQSNSFADVQLKVAKELGLEAVNINNEMYRINNQSFLPYWFNAHFATRTVANQFYTFSKAYKIKRARTAIKIFRNRVDITDISELLYGNLFERLKYWRELSVGHKAISDGLENYVDRQDLYRLQQTLTTAPVEYTKLRNKENILFQDKALIEFVLPSTAQGIHNFKFGLVTDGNPQFYVRKYQDSSLAIPITPASAVFVISDNILSISEGDVFTDTLNEGVQFTVISVYTSTNQIVCSASDIFVNPGATTDTLTRVSDSITFTATHLTTGVPQNYLKRAEESFGKWELLQKSEDGLFHIDDIQPYMNYDKVSILVDNNKTPFNISDVYALYGTPLIEKDRDIIHEYLKNRNFETTLLEDNFVGSSGILSSENGSYIWDGNETYKDNGNSDVTNNHIPNYYKSKGATKILHLKKGDKITYTVENFNHNRNEEPAIYKLRIVGRYFPASNLDINADDFTITPTTFDFAKIGIKYSIGGTNSTFIDEMYLPASFIELDKEIYFDMNSIGNKLELIAIDDDIELLYVELSK